MSSPTAPEAGSGLSPEQVDEILDRKRRQGRPGYGVTMLNELVKSYGFKFDKGDVTWDVENIKKAFKDDPIWTSLDYLTLGIAPAKFGVAAIRAGRATSSAARAYRGGEITFKQFRQLDAARPGRKLGFFANPVGAGRRIADEQIDLMEGVGHSPEEARGIVQALDNERRAEEAFYATEGEDIIKRWGRFDEATQAKGRELLGDPTAVPGAAAGPFAMGREEMARQLGSEEATRLYERTAWLRNTLHEDGYDLNLLTRATHHRELYQYNPNVYKEIIEAEVQSGRTRLGSMVDHYLPRTGDDHGMTNLLNPRTTTAVVARAGSAVARQRWIQNIAGNSVVAKSADEFGAFLQQIAQNPELAKLHGYGDDVFELARDGDLNGALKRAGWVKFDDVLKMSGGGKIPGFAERLPKEMRDKWFDPHAVEQMASTLVAAEKAPLHETLEKLQRAYWHSMGFFRAGKTAYSPATFARNEFGNMVFYHLATNSFKVWPSRGMKAYAEKGEDWRESLRAGVSGTTFSEEIRETNLKVAKLIDEDGVEPNALSFLGDSRVAKTVQKMGARAEQLYMSRDEVWKLDAFLELRDKALRSGRFETRDEAVEWAAGEVAKFMPQFATHSPGGNLLRKAIPFASFTTEALRVWKNAIVEKPVTAFFYNHMAEEMTQIAGGVAGFTPDEIEKAREHLPHYQQGKKMAMLPFRIDGKASFLDLSYMIPMANISEASTVEELFFGGLYDPSANPLFNISAAMVTGVDPFTKQEVAPHRFERATGIAIEQPHARKLFGMAEHMAATMAPPLMPPGYSGVNILEHISQERHYDTGLPLEPNLGRTIAANLVGLRTYEASPSAQTINVRQEQRERGRSISRWRKRWRHAMANGNTTEAQKAEEALYRIKEEQNPGSGTKYIRRLRRDAKPGSFRSYSTRELREIIARSRQIGDLTPEQEDQIRAMRRVLRERRKR